MTSALQTMLSFWLAGKTWAEDPDIGRPSHWKPWHGALLLVSGRTRGGERNPPPGTDLDRAAG